MTWAFPFQGYHQRREAEWAGALVLLGVAVALLLPGATFSRPTFDAFSDIAAEGTWGAALCVRSTPSVPRRRQRLVVELIRDRRGGLGGGAAQERHHVEPEGFRDQDGVPDVRRRARLQAADDANGHAGHGG